jgi:hypothetical protein
VFVAERGLTPVLVQVLFIFLYAYIMLYLHLPPERGPMSSRLVTSYYVNTEKELAELTAKARSVMRKKRRKKAGGSQSNAPRHLSSGSALSEMLIPDMPTPRCRS